MTLSRRWLGQPLCYRDEGVDDMTVIEGFNLDSDSGDVFASS